VFVGWAWYVVTLIPMIGLIQVGTQAMADRYMYLPMIGLLVIVAWGAADLIDRLTMPRARYLRLGVAALVLVAAVDARSLTFAWSDSVSLWSHAIANSDGNYLAYVNLGSALVERGDLAGGLDAYRRGLATLDGRWPGYQAAIHCNIAAALL